MVPGWGSNVESSVCAAGESDADAETSGGTCDDVLSYVVSVIGRW